MEYINEWLLPKHLGLAAIVLSFVAAGASALSYFLAARRRTTVEGDNWNRLGRGFFGLHGLATFTTIGLVFYVMVQQRFEYQYVWAHVSEDLPFRYIFSAFWEGQEGSFMLWMFWHVVLGMILMFRARKFEAPVMFSIALAEMFMASMLLGLHFGEFKLGSNPLVLLRDTMDAPIFALADYVERIQGQGLNPLLQNYWNTIHPPVMFLGFASTIVPFGFALGGLWYADHKGWLNQALKWALFCGAVLGTGLLMGSAWAYEALSFGGYWAWDPVENTSLVPWIVLVAGIHTNLIAKATGHSVRATYGFYLASFLLIVYSTTLTRTGVLGDTSVHAFTEMGLEWQLLAYIGTMTLLGFGLLAARYRSVPAPKREEKFSSKEFWMFIGSLVLLFSSILITAATSLPVFNLIAEQFNPDHQAVSLADPVEHHNRYQLWIGVLVALLSGGAQFLRWREPNFANNKTRWLKHIGIAAGGAALMTWVTSLWITLGTWQYTLLTFAGWFAVVSNLDYLFSAGRANLKMAGSALSHVGFGVLLVGIIASGVNQYHISTNPFEQEALLAQDMIAENVLLFRDRPMHMSGYRVTFAGDTLVGNERTFDIQYEKLDDNGEVAETFTVHPSATYNNTVTKIAAFNPDSKHYLGRDIFTHIAALDSTEFDADARRAFEKRLEFATVAVPLEQQVVFRDTMPVNARRDTMLIRNYRVEVKQLIYNPTHPDYQPEEGDLAVGAEVEITHLRTAIGRTVRPAIALRGNVVYTFDEQINDLGLRVRLPQEVLDVAFPREDELGYESVQMKQGASVAVQGYDVEFLNVVPNPQHPQYQPQENDIAVGARLRVTDRATGTTAEVQPVYLIRDNRPFTLKANDRNLGFHVRFPQLDPETETFTFLMARHETAETAAVPVQIAANSPRTDFIILETIVFPGINLVWVGSIVMLIGLAVALVARQLAIRRTLRIA